MYIYIYICDKNKIILFLIFKTSVKRLKVH